MIVCAWIHLLFSLVSAGNGENMWRILWMSYMRQNINLIVIIMISVYNFFEI